MFGVTPHIISLANKRRRKVKNASPGRQSPIGNTTASRSGGRGSGGRIAMKAGAQGGLGPRASINGRMFNLRLSRQ